MLVSYKPRVRETARLVGCRSSMNPGRPGSVKGDTVYHGCNPSTREKRLEDQGLEDQSQSAL